jgi:SAM-dependent methyltransferase
MLEAYTERVLVAIMQSSSRDMDRREILGLKEEGETFLQQKSDFALLWEDENGRIYQPSFLAISRRPKEYKFILENLPSPPATLFEIGCGRGEIGVPTCYHISQITKIVLHKGYRLFGCDLHDIWWNDEDFTYFRRDFLEAPFPENAFDAGYAVQVISHIGMKYFMKRGNAPFDLNADYRVWKKISKLLKPKGIFVTGMPFAKKFTTYVSKLMPTDKGRVYDEKRLRDVLKKAKLKLLKKEVYSGWNPKIGDNQITKLGEVNLALITVKKD